MSQNIIAACGEVVRRSTELHFVTEERLRPALGSNFANYLERVVPNSGDITIEQMAKQAAVLAELISAGCASAGDKVELLASDTRQKLVFSLSTVSQQFKEFSEQVGGFLTDDISGVEEFQLVRKDGQKLNLLERLSQIGSSLESLKKLLPELTSVASGPPGPSLANVISEYLDGAQRQHSLLQEMEKSGAEYRRLLASMNETASQLGVLLEQGRAQLNQIESARGQSEAARASSESASKQASELMAAAKALGDQIAGEQARLNVFRQTVEAREAQIKSSSEELERITKAIVANDKAVSELISKAEKLLSHATSSALAVAFHREARKRAWGAILSLIGAIVLLSAMVFLLAWIAGVVPHEVQQSIAGDDLARLTQIFLRLGALIPLAFGVAILAKNLAVNRLMREEYAHKASLSTALEGYRALLVAEDEQKELVKKTMERMYRNPAEGLDQSAEEADMTKILRDLLATVKGDYLTFVKGAIKAQLPGGPK
jgi:hypothetical protein